MSEVGDWETRVTGTGVPVTSATEMTGGSKPGHEHLDFKNPSAYHPEREGMGERQEQFSLANGQWDSASFFFNAFFL